MMNVEASAMRKERFTLVTAEMPDDTVTRLPEGEWPANWDRVEYVRETLDIGTEWVRHGDFLALIVPSTAHLPRSYNVLINPAHPAFDQLRVLTTEQFTLNERFIRDEAAHKI